MHFCLVFSSVIPFFFRCLVRRGFTNDCNENLVLKVKILGTTLSGSGFLEMLDEQPSLRTNTLTRPRLGNPADLTLWKVHYVKWHILVFFI